MSLMIGFPIVGLAKLTVPGVGVANAYVLLGRRCNVDVGDPAPEMVPVIETTPPEILDNVTLSPLSMLKRKCQIQYDRSNESHRRLKQTEVEGKRHHYHFV